MDANERRALDNYHPAHEAKALDAMAAAADAKPDGPWEVRGPSPEFGIYAVVHKTTGALGFMDHHKHEAYRRCGELNDAAALMRAAKEASNG